MKQLSFQQEVDQLLSYFFAPLVGPQLIYVVYFRMRLLLLAKVAVGRSLLPKTEFLPGQTWMPTTDQPTPQADPMKIPTH